MQGTQIQLLVWEDPPGNRATEPTCHNYWSPGSLELVLQQVRPLQRVALRQQWRPNAAKKTNKQTIFLKFRDMYKFNVLVMLT